MSDPLVNLQVVDPMTVSGMCSTTVRTAEDLEPALPVPVPVADADADAPELVVDAATWRPFPMVLVGTHEDVAGAGCASGVGLWPWNQVDVP